MRRVALYYLILAPHTWLRLWNVFYFVCNYRGYPEIVQNGYEGGIWHVTTFDIILDNNSKFEVAYSRFIVITWCLPTITFREKFFGDFLKLGFYHDFEAFVIWAVIKKNHVIVFYSNKSEFEFLLWKRPLLKAFSATEYSRYYSTHIDCNEVCLGRLQNYETNL